MPLNEYCSTADGGFTQVTDVVEVEVVVETTPLVVVGDVTRVVVVSFRADVVN